jgi:hypothetical protein
MTRCEKCGLPIEAEDLVEDENPDSRVSELMMRSKRESDKLFF